MVKNIGTWWNSRNAAAPWRIPLKPIQNRSRKNKNVVDIGVRT